MDGVALLVRFRCHLYKFNLKFILQHRDLPRSIETAAEWIATWLAVNTA